MLIEQRETFGARNQEVGEVKGLRNPDSTVLLFITTHNYIDGQLLTNGLSISNQLVSH